MSGIETDYSNEGFPSRSGHGDYMNERDRILKRATIDEIVEQVRSAKLDNQIKQ